MKNIYFKATQLETKGLILEAFALFHLSATLGFIPAMFRVMQYILNGFYNMSYNKGQIENAVIQLFPPGPSVEIRDFAMRLLHLLTDNIITGSGKSDVLTITSDGKNLSQRFGMFNFMGNHIPIWLARITNFQCDYSYGIRYELNSNYMLNPGDTSIYLPRGIVISQYWLQMGDAYRWLTPSDVSIIEGFIHDMLPETSYKIRVNSNGSLDIWDFVVLPNII